MSDDVDSVYQVCTDFTVYKYGNVCKSSWDLSRCATDSDQPCILSYDFADRRKWRSKTKGCRTVPDSLRNDVVGNDVFKWSKRQ